MVIDPKKREGIKRNLGALLADISPGLRGKASEDLAESMIRMFEQFPIDVERSRAVREDLDLSGGREGRSDERHAEKRRRQAAGDGQCDPTDGGRA